MNTWTSWITPGFPLIGTSRRVEVESASVEHASLLIRRAYPGHSYTRPRLVETPSYRPDAVDSDFALFGWSERKALEVCHA